MSYLLNDPAAFAAEAADGFVLAHRGLVRHVSGGVARAAATPTGKVAVVIGGGSGHYPAFAGLVGPGLADAAAMGNVFASPSANHVHAVARSVEAGAGVLLSYGNYAGDVINFDQAQERLIADGVPCRSVQVTDDVSSASTAERSRRRGVAGDLVVFKVAAWAAERGLDLDGVTELAARANDRTRSIGVAFSGTTLPGSDSPLFTVPHGRMAVGMGIHGEPGISEEAMPTADDLAALLTRRLLDELPDGVDAARGARAAVILNGLGSVKGEELFVLYGAVARLLADEGVDVVDPDVGEFATSFEMAGVSLTLMWLDDDLEQAWRAPAYTAGYRKGRVQTVEAVTADDKLDQPAAVKNPEEVGDATEVSRASGLVVVRALDAVRAVIDERADDLGRLDAIAGDGDHGIGMQHGATAAAEAARAAQHAGAGVGTVLVRAGDAWADRAGGTSGALWGAALGATGSSLGDHDAVTAESLLAAVHAAADAVVGFGKAEVGDKTMVDALVPFVGTLERALAEGADPVEAWTSAAQAATAAADGTARLVPRRGRARTHDAKSVGTPDPGAVSLALVVTAAAAIFDMEGTDT